ncbi:hypothetical protein, variant [Saprolegnia diclina VS20]|uniref:Cyclic nucleotide-binding domain-containing protein n=1 Tax=Saprolegnia diclina (strain VS20) TaxID=1156394 RepID=T0RBU9_SAPDV|nr:hypothetical protein, variant [Saprolegnia diclina VS20]EQC29678.1 hypothetical protein, variant [Saprolegnia diclina VS20]|eukprot:XP_008616982.1 hypothetical protein, variant [Saprolegnia diclina VS20]
MATTKSSVVPAEAPRSPRRPTKLVRSFTERAFTGLRIDPNEQIARAAKSVLIPKEEIEIFHSPDTGASPYMLHPNSVFRRVWDVCAACSVVCVCLLTPLELGFQNADWRQLSALGTFLDVFFVTDMVLTFRTGYLISGEIVMNQRLVMWHYAESWLLIDCLSNFPFYLFYSHANQSSVKFLKLQKIPKMLRFARLLKYMRQYAKYYNFVLVVVAIVISLHVLTCLWASLFDQCIKNVYDASTNQTYCDDTQMEPMYLEALLNVLMLYTSLGEYSTYASIGNLESPLARATPTVYLLSICIVVLGLVSIAVFLANIISIFISWDQQSAQFRNRMDIISAEMKHYEIPLELQRRVKRNYDYLWINQRAYSEMTLLSQRGISKSLRTTIALFLYKDLLETVPFFAGENAKLLGRICLLLETAVYLPGDLIIQVDDLGKEMFIVRRGVVEILIANRPENAPRILLKDGAFFGETALVVEVRRTSSVQSVTVTDLNVLNKQAFDEIIAEFPDFFQKMKRIVVQRQMDNMHISNDADKTVIERELNAVIDHSLTQRASDVSSPYWRYSEANKTGNKLKRIAERLKHSEQTTVVPITRPKRRKRSSALRVLTGLSVFSHNPIKSALAKKPSFLRQPVTRRTTEPAVSGATETPEAELQPSLTTISQRLRVVEASIAALPTYMTALQTTMQQLQADLARLQAASTPTELPSLHVSPLHPAMQ